MTLFTTVFVDTRLWKTKRPRKRFQNFHQSCLHFSQKDTLFNFNNCFIIHFSHNSSSENRSEAFSHFVSEENTPRGLVTRQTLNMLNAIPAADIAFIMSSSQAIVSLMYNKIVCRGNVIRLPVMLLSKVVLVF